MVKNRKSTRVFATAGFSTQKVIFRYVISFFFNICSYCDCGIYFTASDPQNSRGDDQYRICDCKAETSTKCISVETEVRLY